MIALIVLIVLALAALRIYLIASSGQSRLNAFSSNRKVLSDGNCVEDPSRIHNEDHQHSSAFSDIWDRHHP